jgi:hypothetical protein
MVWYMDTAKLFYDRHWDGRIAPLSESWYAGMNTALKDDEGNSREIFGYLLPPWGLPYTLKVRAPDTAGDWAVLPAPVPYLRQSAWIAIRGETHYPGEVKELIGYLFTDQAFLGAYAAASGAPVPNRAALDTLKDSHSEAFLGGQNHYALLAALFQDESLNAGSRGGMDRDTDRIIEALFLEETAAYARGEKKRDQAIEDFTSRVKAKLEQR